jgi:hypothetical protein
MGGLLGKKSPPPAPVRDYAAEDAAAQAEAKKKSDAVLESETRRRAGIASTILFGNTPGATGSNTLG